MDIYDKLKKALKSEIEKNNLYGHNICVRCKALSSSEAIGNPEHNDYPITKGKEVMVEAIFQGAKGQAFTDEFENADYTVDDILNINTDSNKKRASFIAALNAVFRHLNICNKTVHCKDDEPKKCADNITSAIGNNKNVLLVGHQPRFLEAINKHYNIRVMDMDQDNIGSNIDGVIIEPPEVLNDAIKWCDIIFATGSTIVNGTITNFLNQNKEIIFFGVTISAASTILNLKTYCYCGS